jgi:putative oxidoreductase
MYLLERVTSWSDKHHPKYLDYFRILFGIFIFIKGINLVTTGDSLIPGSDYTALSFIIRIASVILISGGSLFAIGLLTRLATLFLIPVIIITQLITIQVTNVYTFDVFLSILVLLTSILFLVEGSGKWSMDYYLKTHSDN